MKALAGCDLVVEAVVESAEVKSQVFRKIAEAAGPQVLAKWRGPRRTSLADWISDLKRTSGKSVAASTSITPQA